MYYVYHEVKDLFSCSQFALVYCSSLIHLGNDRLRNDCMAFDQLHDSNFTGLKIFAFFYYQLFRSYQSAYGHRDAYLD